MNTTRGNYRAPETSVSGYIAPGFEIVHRAFAANFTRRSEVGAAFAAYLNGDLIVDLWGGIADRVTGRPWAEDTLQIIFSGGKGLVAAAVLMLVDRGQVHLEEPLATYWPEFRQAGKKAITVSDVVSHQAGLPAIDAKLSTDAILQPDTIAALLAQQAPMWQGQPGQSALWRRTLSAPRNPQGGI